MPAIVIVGAGVIGASIAWHLVARGERDVLLVDRAAGPGGGSTGLATGGFRAQYATPINVRLSLLAREKLRRFGEDVGGDAGYVPAGYLWLASTRAELEGLREAQRLQHEEGLHEAVMVDLDDIRRLNPAVALDGLAGGAFCPTDGFVWPLGILEGYLAAAQRGGARVAWGTDVRGGERDGHGRLTALTTGSGRIEADVFVNAAGAWAAALAHMAGLALPVEPLRRQVASTVPTNVLPATMPMTIVVGDGFHLRVRDGRVLLLWPSPGALGDPFDATVDDDWVREVTRKAHAWVPSLCGVPVDRAACWAGLYEMSPDAHAMVGALPACPNLYFANGSSGHGVMHAPALGHLLAEIVLDGRATTLDVRPLRPARFEEGDPVRPTGRLAL
jgi:sarcosine oxidase, subunit beta